MEFGPSNQHDKDKRWRPGMPEAGVRPVYNYARKPEIDRGGTSLKKKPQEPKKKQR